MHSVQSLGGRFRFGFWPKVPNLPLEPREYGVIAEYALQTSVVDWRP